MELTRIEYSLLKMTNYIHKFKDGSTTKLELHTSQLFRDVAAWYHIVVAFDINLSQSNRVKIYINGTQVTSFDINRC